MLIIALFIAAADVPQALLDRSDDASAAYVRCLFGVTREANAARLPIDQFERRLASSCAAEETLLRELSARVFALRGHANPQAEVDALLRDARRQMLADYRQLPEQERALKELARLCQEHPEQCGQ